jgi:hypothetical protein
MTPLALYPARPHNGRCSGQAVLRHPTRNSRLVGTAFRQRNNRARIISASPFGSATDCSITSRAGTLRAWFSIANRLGTTSKRPSRAQSSPWMCCFSITTAGSIPLTSSLWTPCGLAPSSFPPGTPLIRTTAFCGGCSRRTASRIYSSRRCWMLREPSLVIWGRSSKALRATSSPESPRAALPIGCSFWTTPAQRNSSLRSTDRTRRAECRRPRADPSASLAA